MSHCRLIVDLLPRGDGGVPRSAVLARTPAAAGTLPDVDLEALRRFPLRISRADGTPASAAEVIVFATPDARPIRWGPIHHVVAGLDGCTELLLDAGAWALYVSSRETCAFVFLDADRESGAIDVALEPVPTARCRVVDADGEPVRGAHVEQAGQLDSFRGNARNAEQSAKQAVAVWVAWPTAVRARSQRDGVLHVPLQDWLPWRPHARVRQGARTSSVLELRADVDSGDVIVK